MAGYELPQIWNGEKADHVWIYPTGIPQDDQFTDPILVQSHHRINCGLRVGDDAKSILTALGIDWAAPGKWFDLDADIVLQRRMPEETEDYHWRTVETWTIAMGDEFEEIVDMPAESCYHRLGVLSVDYNFGSGILRIGTT